MGLVPALVPLGSTCRQQGKIEGYCRGSRFGSTWFGRRMAKVEQHMNEEMGEGLSLLKLGKELHDRCEKMKQLKGERIPK